MSFDVVIRAGTIVDGTGLPGYVADVGVREGRELDRGDHFAALEEPDLLVDDVRAFFRPLR